MTRVKICGITSISDARAACEAGADAIGLNFYPQSRRYVSVAEASEIRKHVPGNVQVVGVFVNAIPADIREACVAVHLGAAQLHGDEVPSMVEELSQTVAVFKAFRAGSDFRTESLKDYPSAAAFLLDAPDYGGATFGQPSAQSTRQYGGTGRLADWNIAQKAALVHRIILAGGLDDENVAGAVLQVRPYAVDVASGVESSTGAKDHRRLRKFIEEVRRADQKLKNLTEKVRMT